MGRSGSGKSTIASLLTRFYDLQQGQILLDGEPIEAYRLADLRRQFALVSQQVHLFNDTVANNIAYAARITSYNVCYTKLLRLYPAWRASRLAPARELGR